MLKPRIRFEQFNDSISRLYPEILTSKTDKILDVTFQVTDACNLRCSYCYQLSKNNHAITFDQAKKYVNYLLNLKEKNEYLDPNEIKGFVFNFIGGEPFLQIDLIEQVTDYIISTMLKNNDDRILFTKFLICSNGTLYFNKKVQDYLAKYSGWVSLSISIDGNKELHDSCRIFPDGTGSYDLAIAAAKHYKELTGDFPTTKITLSPNNIAYLFEAAKNLIDVGYRFILGNVIFEEGWNLNHAKIYYKELLKLADYIIDNDYEFDRYIAFFEDPEEGNFFLPYNWNDDDDIRNWCGGNGDMIAMNHTGQFYPCLRYMEDSLNGQVPPFIVGDVERGFVPTEEQKQKILELKKVNTYTQSSDECRNCPIAKGCAWCQAYNYQCTGCVNQRVTFICPMHKARCLANEYYWNKLYKKHGVDKTFPNNMKQEWIDELLN